MKGESNDDLKVESTSMMTKKMTMRTSSGDPMKNQRRNGDKITIAQREANTQIVRYSNEKGIRKSKRLLSFISHPKIKTSKMRRLDDLFWFDDIVDCNCDGCGDDGGDVGSDAIHDNHGLDANISTKNISTNVTTNANSKKKAKAQSDLYKVSPRLHLKRIYSSPNIYTIENFLTESELMFLDKKIRFANEKGLFHDSFIDGEEVSSSNNDGRRKRKKRKKDAPKTDADKNAPCRRYNNRLNGIENDTEVTEDVQCQPLPNQSQGEKMAASERTSKQRTSKFIHFTKLSNSVITSIEQRACELLSLPNNSIEPLQLVKYDVGQYFSVHHDLGVLYDDGSVELPQRKNTLLSPPRRIVTVLVYLNDVEKCNGGSTQFPLLIGKQRNTNKDQGNNLYTSNGFDNDGRSKCLEIYPKRGMAVIWCNIKKDGTPDERVVHSGQPLMSDDVDSNSRSAPVKYIMNIWACED